MILYNNFYKKLKCFGKDNYYWVYIRTLLNILKIKLNDKKIIYKGK